MRCGDHVIYIGRSGWFNGMIDICRAGWGYCMIYVGRTGQFSNVELVGRIA
jgi:hypothetical protein